MTTCPHDAVEAAQLAVPAHGRIDGIHDCPHCGVPCSVRDGQYPPHNCTRKDLR